MAICKMCDFDAILAVSHLMPRALYDYCREGEHRPVAATNGVLIPSDRQIQYPLLCDDCEDVLNDGGETWIAEKLAKYDKTFPLFTSLNSAPQLQVQDTTVYAGGKAPDVDMNKLVHFALGIFWKASVHSWRKGQTKPRIELGKYSERLRVWLLGDAQFPQHMYLVTCIAPPDVAQISLFPPYEEKRSGWHVFFMHVPGILFMLNVGRTVDEPRRALCTWKSPDHVIVYSKDLYGKFINASNTTFRNAKKTQSFLNAMDKIEKAKAAKSSTPSP